ncbi:MAG: DNA-binding protein [Desulfobacterales bacterium]
MNAVSEPGRLTKVIAMRLHPGEDLIEAITGACVAQGMACGAILSCIGSLQRASFFTAVPLANKMGAGYGDPVALEGPLELVSAQGTIGLDPESGLVVHMHGTLGDGRGNLFGGHLIKGRCPILITGEVMIAFLDGVRCVRAHDAETDMNLFSFISNR